MKLPIGLLWKYKKISLAVLTLGVLIGGGVWWQAAQQPKLNTVTVKRATLLQEVAITGTTKAVESVELAFERGGRVKEVLVKTGDTVTMNQPLIRLDDEELQAQLAQAEAGLRNAEAQRTQYVAALAAQLAKYDELRRGTRTEELQISQNAVNSAQQALTDARNNLNNATTIASTELAKAMEAVTDAEASYRDAQSKTQVDLDNLYKGVEDVIRDAYVKAADAVTKQTDDLFYNDTSTSPRLTYTSSDSQAQTDVESQRYATGQVLDEIKRDLSSLPSDQAGLDTVLARTKTRLDVVKNFLNRLNDTLTASSTLNSSTLASYKSNLSTALTNISSALSAVSTRQQTISAQRQTGQSAITTAKNQVNSAKQALEIREATNNNTLTQAKAAVTSAEAALKNAQDQLALKKAGATSEQLKAQEAAISQARANILSQEAQIQSAQSNIQFNRSQLSKTILNSPLTGLVTKQDAKVGEIINASAQLVTLISDKQFEVEANVPESDIGRVAVGQDVRITFDALVGKDFVGKVATIDPAETIVDGVVNFKLRVALGKDGGVRSGMTANLVIEALKKENVLIVPQVAVIENDQGMFVKRVQPDGSVEQVGITIGARGKDGDVEVLSGVIEGDVLVDTSIKAVAK